MATRIGNMMTNLKAGAILRRGTTGLRPDQLKDLYDNADKVKAILDEIEARRALFIEAERDAMERINEAEKVEAELAKREGVLVVEKAALEAATAEAEIKHKADMDALGRRTREVVAKEAAMDERATTLERWAAEIVETETDIQSFTSRLNEAVAKGRLATDKSQREH